MGKPPFREDDEMPKRVDDIRIVFPFNMGSVEASGRTVVGIILVIAALGYLFWHDFKTERAHEASTRTLQTVICVLTLNEAERREYRLSGKYCATAFYLPNIGRDENVHYQAHKLK